MLFQPDKMSFARLRVSLSIPTNGRTLNDGARLLHSYFATVVLICGA